MIDLANLSTTEMATLDALDLALFWARRGCPVVPANPETKAPWVGREWHHKATLNEAQIRAWWQARPTARVGIKTGLSCGDPACVDGPDVIDFDTGWDPKVSLFKPGIEQRRILVDAGILDGTSVLRLVTPTTTETGRGEHWWFLGAAGAHNKQNDDSVWGVDLRALHGMVLAPGNPGYEVKSVPWGEWGEIKWADVVACPGLVVKPGQEPKVAPVVARSLPAPVPTTRPTPGKLKAPPSNFVNAPGEESPLDWFVRNHSFRDVLAADGWTYAYTDAQDRAYWVRPGKKEIDGVSANVMVNPDGRETLMNFSTTVDLPTDRGLSIAQYVAYRDHGGRVADLASHVRKTMMPRRPAANTMALVASPATPGGPRGMDAPPAPPSVSVGLPGRELVVSAEVGTPQPVADFWSRRRELKEVWYRSVRGGVSPWAVLGNLLANVAGRVGPHVALPPRGGVGKAASLNILVGVMGNSGTGKGLSGPVAREFMGQPYPPQRKPGTGQGIAAMFTEQTKEGPVQSNDTVVLNVSEITQLGAHMSQQGATITSTLLEVFMAEELGEHYANKELRRPVRDGAYRLAMVAGIQPGNSAILFDHAESGLPQRFVWMPAFWADAVLPEGSLLPPPPGSELNRWRIDTRLVPGSLDETIEWSPTDATVTPAKKSKEPEVWPVPVKDPILVEYAPSVKFEIDREQNRRLNAIKRREASGEDDPGDPDSHLLLTRAKIAALLAIWLDHTWHVSAEMWELSKWVMWVSNDTRLKAHARLRAKAQEKTAGRAAARVTETAMINEAAEREHNAVYIRALDRILHLLGTKPGDAGGWTTINQVHKGMASQEKKKMREAGIDTADVLADLEQAGKIESREPIGTEQGSRYRAKR